MRKVLARALRWLADKIDHAAESVDLPLELPPSELWYMRELAPIPYTTPIDFAEQWDNVVMKYGYPLPDDEEDYRHGIYL